MNYDICSNCGRFGNMDHHICPPVWYVRTEDWEPDDYTEIRADTAKEAACTFAEYDLADTSVMGKGEWDVFVRAEMGPDTWQKFQVNMEMEPVFSAKELRCEP